MKYTFSNAGQTFSAAAFSKYLAGLLENVVYLDLVRRGYDVYAGKLNNLEVDFAAVRKEEKLYIQVSERIVTAGERKYGSLLSIADHYPKYVLHMDECTGENHAKIKTMHAADFLLSQEY